MKKVLWADMTDDDPHVRVSRHGIKIQDSVKDKNPKENKDELRSVLRAPQQVEPR
jgi:hypothetical protein